MIYGSEGTQALFTGLVTQVVYGGCDADTAEFYSKASGTATTDANQDDPNSHLRQRPLLTVDEVITPQVGNCTIFARYVEAGFATQVILNARLTRFDERDDWQQQLATEVNREPLLLERGISLPTSPVASLDAAPQAGDALLERAARSRLSAIERTMNLTTGSKVKLATVSELRARLKQHQQERTP
jgi:type IV secretory pathway TraG/TraD family ATPase VirD4